MDPDEPYVVREQKKVCYDELLNCEGTLEYCMDEVKTCLQSIQDVTFH